MSDRQALGVATAPVPMAARTRFARRLVLSAYFAMLLFLIAWYAWLNPSRYFPVGLTLLCMVGPLLFPLRGLLDGRPYTHAWTTYLVLFYFAHGLSQAWTIEDDRFYAIIEVTLSVLLFAGLVLFARWRGRELRPVPGLSPGAGNARET